MRGEAMNFGHGYKPSKYGSKKIVYHGKFFEEDL